VIKNLISGAPYFARHVKPLVLAAFAVVSTHQFALGPRGPFSLSVIHKGGLCSRSEDINMVMMKVLMSSYVFDCSNLVSRIAVNLQSFFSLLPTHCVSCVARINSGIPLIDNEQ
jgi:hypothetical protein